MKNVLKMKKCFYCNIKNISYFFKLLLITTKHLLQDNSYIVIYYFISFALSNIFVFYIISSNRIEILHDEINILTSDYSVTPKKLSTYFIYENCKLYKADSQSTKEYIENNKMIKYSKNSYLSLNLDILIILDNGYIIFDFSKMFSNFFSSNYYFLLIMIIVTFIFLLLGLNKRNNIGLKKLDKRDNEMYSKSLMILTENLHHELSTPILLIKNTLFKIKKQFNALEKCKDCQECLVKDFKDSTNSKKCEYSSYNSKKDFKMLDSSVHQISDIISKMKIFKDVSCKESDKSNIRSIYDIIETSANVLQVSQSDKFNIEISKELKLYKAHSKYLKNGELTGIILNLFKNSIEARATNIKVTFGKKNGLCTFYIGDNGNGIPDRIKKKIYNKNFSSKGERGPRGNGLYVSNFIIKDAGGSIKLIESSIKGTLFEIKIPTIFI